MPDRITKPGIYPDFPINDYHADPAPTPSLTQSLAKLLVDRSPRHAWVAHPRLNPEFERDEATKFDIANVAHAYLIGRGKQIAVIHAEDWRTKLAKEAREKAIAEGRLPVLEEQNERAREMADAAVKQLTQMGLGADWNPKSGAGEVVIAWNEAGGYWYRSMIDWLPKDGRIVYDLKTTRASASPEAVRAKLFDDGWDIQAAMHERGLNVLDPSNTGRRKHRFVCIECEPPFALTVNELPEAVMVMGRKRLDMAIARWCACLDVGTHLEAWPAYGLEINRPEYPDWAEKRVLDREVADDVRRPAPAPQLMPPV